jgi:hypothetical protein
MTSVAIEVRLQVHVVVMMVLSLHINVTAHWHVPCSWMKHSNTNNWPPIKHNYLLYLDIATGYRHLQPSLDHQYNILKWGKIQYTCIHFMKSHRNDEVGTINKWMFLFMLHMCLYLQISHFTIQCFICEDLVNMQCILGNISVLVVHIEPDSIWLTYQWKMMGKILNKEKLL